jgi:tetratricopeptide (TPR) repeat protein
MGAMLDSRATVYLAMGDTEKALADLTEALADAETPVRLFHQAQAYEQAGRRADAVASMDKALRKGLTKEMLHLLEAPTFEKLRRLR